ncbi:MAG: 23S rRNA (uracil(1939)-C(5))-methyltransferase RlmD [Planctomycetota bacterium]|nr:23S rRNA (uracil(1939)-C(5))-methyltransferase RlmD [Planctomycetota bacterium]
MSRLSRYDKEAMTLSCPHFGECGGCTELTTPIAAQRAAKLVAVREALGPQTENLEFGFTDQPDREPRHDRLRILYPVQPDSERGLRMGLYRRGSHQAIEIQSCELQHPALTTIAQRAQQIFRQRSMDPYDEHRHQGLLRAFHARLSASTGEVLLGVVTTGEPLPDPHGLARELFDAARDLPVARGKHSTPVGVVHNRNPKPGNVLLGQQSVVLTGRDHLFDKVDGLTFRVGFASFYQLHRRAQSLLYQPAMAMLAPYMTGAHIVDAYGGVGTFALRCVRRNAGAVTLVENHPQACEDAAFNSQANNTPIKVLRASFPDADIQSPDLLIVDPTRAGLQPAGCAKVSRLAAPQLLYVACSLPALARDLAELPQYRLAELQLADLFPHTAHVELLARLEHRPSGHRG